MTRFFSQNLILLCRVPLVFRRQLFDLPQHFELTEATFRFVLFDTVDRPHDGAPVSRGSEVFAPFKKTKARVFFQLTDVAPKLRRKLRWDKRLCGKNNRLTRVLALHERTPS